MPICLQCFVGVESNMACYSFISFFIKNQMEEAEKSERYAILFELGSSRYRSK